MSRVTRDGTPVRIRPERGGLDQGSRLRGGANQVAGHGVCRDSATAVGKRHRRNEEIAMAGKRIVTTVLVALGAGLLGWGGRTRRPAPGRRRCSTRAAGTASGRPGRRTCSRPCWTPTCRRRCPTARSAPPRGRRTSSCRSRSAAGRCRRGTRRCTAGAYLDTALDGVAQTQMYQSAPGVAVPTTPQTWTWDATSTSTVSASALGHHAFTVTGLTVTVAFQDAGGNDVLATSATCVLDPATPRPTRSSTPTTWSRRPRPRPWR